MKKKTKKSDIRGGLALKVWSLALSSVDYKTIGDEIRYTEETVRSYLRDRGMSDG